jgi:hypothetical protein
MQEKGDTVARRNKARAEPEDARGKGDAVWVVPRTEYVTAPPRVSFHSLLSRQKQVEVVEQALNSFGRPEPAVTRNRAVAEARRVIAGSSVTAPT